MQFVGATAEEQPGFTYPNTVQLAIPGGTEDGDLLVFNWWTINTGVFTPSPGVAFDNSTGWTQEALTNTSRVGITCVYTKFYEEGVDPTTFDITLTANNSRAYDPVVVLHAWRGVGATGGFTAQTNEDWGSSAVSITMTNATTANVSGEVPKTLITAAHMRYYSGDAPATLDLDAAQTEVWSASYTFVGGSTGYDALVVIGYETQSAVGDYSTRTILGDSNGLNGLYGETFRLLPDEIDTPTARTDDSNAVFDRIQFRKVNVKALPHNITTEMVK